MEQVDAVVIGAGPNGLVAANMLADGGLSVVVLEEQPEPGGAVRSGQITLPGYEHDRFSAFYPFAAASPAIRRLELERHGLRWAHAPLAVAHPTPDGVAAVLSRDLDETAASLDRFADGDGDAWRALYRSWRRIEGPFMDAFTTPFPPVRGAVRVAAALRGGGVLGLARTALTPLRRFAEETFRGAGGGLLIGGNALHADLTPETPGGAFFGLVLCGLGQSVGFPVPEGGSGRLTDALARRLAAAGGTVRCGQRVTGIIVHAGRAAGVRTAAGEELAARIAVLADVGAPQLYGELLADIPSHGRLGDVRRRMRRFQYDNSTVKVDWALSAPIPWRSADARRAGTIHTGESIEAMSAATGSLQRRLIPERPLLVAGQYAAADPTRAPAGAETAWAYTHVPQSARGDERGELAGRWDAAELENYAARIEAEIELLAPGFGTRIAARHLTGPHEFEAENRNLVAGAINGGTAQFHQQAVFRPVLGSGRPETPITDLLLASASAHPGGGVHGAPGAIAATVVLRRRRLRRLR